MKIVYCIYSMGVGGGVERVTTTKVNALVQQGHEVVILTTDYKGQPTSYGLDKSVKIIDFGLGYAEDFNVPIWTRLFRTISKMKRHKKAMSAFLFDYRPDIVVTTHPVETAFLPFIKDGSKKVLEYHGSKFIYRMERSAKSILSLRGLLARIYEQRDACISRNFDAVILLTKEDYDSRGKQKNMYVIPNPLSFEIQESADLSSPIVLAMGRHTEQKDFFSLVDIWEMVCDKFPDWKLRIVGDGYLKGKLYGYVVDKGLQTSISVENGVSDVIPVYKEASIYALTSIFEGFGMVLVEAHALGIPVVSYDCPFGPNEIVRDKKNGFLIPPGNKSIFAEKLAILMRDESLRREMGARAKKDSSRYHLEHIMGLWIKLFKYL